MLPRRAVSESEFKFWNEPAIVGRASRWNTLMDVPMSAMALDDLFNNRVPAIRVRNFATAEECARLTRVIRTHGTFESYSFKETANNILKIGPAQCEFGRERKHDYFSAARFARGLHSELRNAGFNPVDRVAELLEGTATRGVSIAYEDDAYGPYFAGVVRNISQGAKLHMDFAPWDAKGWAIEPVQAQVSWNLYVRAPAAGGECVVHDRQWTESDEAFKVDGSYHYDSGVVEGRQKKVNPFVTGDLVFFNTRNFHEVNDSEGLRLTMSSFVGRFPNGNLVLWS